MTHATPQGFIARHLDPGDSLAEVMCGLIMVLTFTLVGSIGGIEGTYGTRGLMLAALGCNLAWGLIDGALYVMSRVLEHGRHLRLARELATLDDDRAALRRVRAELDPELAPVAGRAEREALYRSMVERLRRMAGRQPGVNRSDLMGAFAIFILNVAAVIPAMVPFLLFDDPHRALRVSNAVLIAVLFVVGWTWAGHAGVSRFKSGLAVMAIGVGLVAIAIALGG